MKWDVYLESGRLRKSKYFLEQDLGFSLIFYFIFFDFSKKLRHESLSLKPRILGTSAVSKLRDVKNNFLLQNQCEGNLGSLIWYDKDGKNLVTIDKSLFRQFFFSTLPQRSLGLFMKREFCQKSHIYLNFSRVAIIQSELGQSQ